MSEPRKQRGMVFNDDKRDDGASAIAVTGKENDRSAMLADEGRAIEPSDERSKMALRKRLDLVPLSTEECGGMEILRKLPPGTIVIKQEKKYKEDSDYVRDSAETSSGGSTSGGAVAKLRRVHRAARRNRGTTEIRRNPIRVTKKDLDKDFPRPRQRLLSAKRKEMLLDAESSKRGKSSTMPYMNTRSVTRKMYNVGATYQAPTPRDETEWKEWPAHGMHERPVFHPQVGLAAEYLGRYYSSLDGHSYHEIIDRPEIEVVSVDPHCDFLPSSAEKKRNRKARTNRASSMNTKASSLSPSEMTKSFQTCMHESFHCVLGYCSQVLTPTYKNNVEGKISKLNGRKNSSIVAKDTEKQASSIAEYSCKGKASVGSKDISQKLMEGSKLLDNYTVTMTSQNIKNFSQVSKTRLFPAQKVYVANSQKSISFTNLKTLQGGQMKIQEVIQSAKNPLVLVNPLEAKSAQVLKSVPGSVMKLEDTTEEPLADMSSLYQSLIPGDILMDNSKVTGQKQTPTKRRNKVEFTVTKYLFDNKVQIAKEVNSEKKCYEASSKELNVKAMSGGLNKTWCTNEASEIAKILSEYNKSSLKKPAIDSQAFCAKNIAMKDACGEEKMTAQEESSDRNVNIKFPQGKWRRFHLTVEKLKDMKGGRSEKRASSGVQSKQSLFKIDQTSVNAALERKSEVPKYSEPFQREQSSVGSSEKKENTSMNSNVDSAKTQCLQELLENTAMLYCAATGTHQDDLANYIDSLDAVQSIQWLETSKNLIV